MTTALVPIYSRFATIQIRLVITGGAGRMRNREARDSSTFETNAEFVISRALEQRLFALDARSALAFAADLPASQRVALAVFCYGKSHLRAIGLAITATCEQSTLVQHLGTTRGRILFTQSRGAETRSDEPLARPRTKVTLPTSAGISPFGLAVPDLDDGCDAVEDEETDLAVAEARIPQDPVSPIA
jgi:hypothetical protein